MCIRQTIGRRRDLALILSLLAFASGALEAQNYDNPGLGEQPVVSHPQDYKPLGIRAGGFMLHPGVQLAAEFNDNVFYTDSDGEAATRDDTIWHVQAGDQPCNHIIIILAVACNITDHVTEWIVGLHGTWIV